MNKSVLKTIDEAIKYIWEYDIKSDYECGWLLKEDTLKNAFYYHLRTKLSTLLENNDLRIFTEFTKDKFQNTGMRPDMVIAKIDLNESSWDKAIQKCLCVIEIKFKSGLNTSKDIYNDYSKLETYIKQLCVNSHIYMATIWEYEDDKTSWLGNKSWAKDKITELNASYKRDTDEMQFYVCEHK